MRNLIKTIAIVFAILCVSISIYAEDTEKDRRLEEAIKVISNPETPSHLKHAAMVTLQELKDVRSVDALYEQIDFVSAWGNPLQRGTTTAYPATYALILIGQPSIEGAERFVSSGKPLNKDQLWLTAFVVREVFRSSSGDEPGLNFRAMTLDWVKKNYTVSQMRKAAELYFPELEAFLSTLSDDPKAEEPSERVDQEDKDSRSSPRTREMNQEMGIEQGPKDKPSSVIPAAQHIPETTAQNPELNIIYWLVGGGVLAAILVLLLKKLCFESGASS